MDIKDIGLTPTIENNKQVVDAYPELFEKISIDNADFYLERQRPNQEENFFEEDRIFLLPSGIISLTTRDLEPLWEINEKDEDFLKELNILAEELNRKKREKENVDLFQVEHINEIEYGILYFPYMDTHPDTILLDMLYKKVLAFREISKQ